MPRYTRVTKYSLSAAMFHYQELPPHQMISFRYTLNHYELIWDSKSAEHKAMVTAKAANMRAAGFKRCPSDQFHRMLHVSANF